MSTLCAYTLKKALLTYKFTIRHESQCIFSQTADSIRQPINSNFSPHKNVFTSE